MRWLFVVESEVVIRTLDLVFGLWTLDLTGLWTRF